MSLVQIVTHDELKQRLLAKSQPDETAVALQTPSVSPGIENEEGL